MRTAVLGCLVGVALAVTALAVMPGRTPVFAQPGGSLSSPGGDLLTLSTTLEGKHQQVVVIDPKQRVMSVYHVELSSGEIALKSVRQFQWDLMLSEFNGVKPLPEEMRRLIEGRR